MNKKRISHLHKVRVIQFLHHLYFSLKCFRYFLALLIHLIKTFQFFYSDFKFPPVSPKQATKMTVSHFYNLKKNIRKNSSFLLFRSYRLSNFLPWYYPILALLQLQLCSDVVVSVRVWWEAGLGETCWWVSLEKNS